jgi:hypothetical protein
MTIRTLTRGIEVKSDKAHLEVEIQVGTAGSNADCLHLYFPERTIIKQEEGHIILILERPKSQE